MSISVSICRIAVKVCVAVPRGRNHSWAAVAATQEERRRSLRGGQRRVLTRSKFRGHNYPSPRRARARARSGEGMGIGIGNISAVGTGADGVTDGVANYVVIAVLVG